MASQRQIGFALLVLLLLYVLVSFSWFGNVHREVSRNELHSDHGTILTKLSEAIDKISKLEKDLAECASKQRRHQSSEVPTCPPPPKCPEETVIRQNKEELEPGAWHQKVYEFKRDEGLPIVGEDFYPWEARLGARYARLIGQDKKIIDGDVSSCSYVDVLFLRQTREVKRCAMIVDQQNLWEEKFLASNIVSFRINKTSGKPEMPLIKDQHRIPDGQRFVERDRRIADYFKAKREIIDKVKKLLNPSGEEEVEGVPVLVMCFNRGMTSLIVNFFCGLRKMKIAIPKHIIFATTPEDAALINGMGFVALSHTGLGAYPDKAAGVYGDNTFGAMMMLKQFSSQIVLEAGYDVLFQDADVVWKVNPMKDLRKRSEYFHALFQDDGGRDQTFHPYFANTGFFYLRNSFLTRVFWDQVTLSMPPYKGRFGNQWILNQALQLYVNRRGFKVEILPHTEYPSGRYIDHPLSKKEGETVKPIFPESRIIHFCWTGNLSDKVHKMEAYNEMHVPKERMLDMGDFIMENHGKSTKDTFIEMCVK